MSRRALVIGIDGYPGKPLATCSDDALRFADALRYNADRSLNWTVTSRVARSSAVPEFLRLDLLADLTALLSDGQDDDVLLYFSGHALMTEWGAELATQDGLAPGLGVPFSTLATMINASCADTITVILDCCYAGELGVALPGGSSGLTHHEVSELRDDVTILAAARGDERTDEGSGFTDLLIDGLAGGASNRRGNVTALTLFSHALTAMNHHGVRPMLRANCTDLPVIRQATPWSSLDTLRSLPQLWERFDAPMLVPHEVLDDDDAVHHLLHACAELEAAHLLALEEALTVERAIRRGIALRLNETGQYYWRLAKKGLL